MLREYRLLARCAGLDGGAHRRRDQGLVPLSRRGRGERRGEVTEIERRRLTPERPSATPAAGPRDKIRTWPSSRGIASRLRPPARRVVAGARHLRPAPYRPRPPSRGGAPARRRADRHHHGRPLRQQGAGPAGVHRAICAPRCWRRCEYVDLVGDQRRRRRGDRDRAHPARRLRQGPGLRRTRGRHHRQDRRRARGGRGATAAASISPTRSTFSSTELINQHLNVFEPHVREHLDTLRAERRRSARSAS